MHILYFGLNIFVLFILYILLTKLICRCILHSSVWGTLIVQVLKNSIEEEVWRTKKQKKPNQLIGRRMN